ncbi:MAG: secretin N-terminal domain-containing protein [Phycisphaerae bacterium]
MKNFMKENLVLRFLTVFVVVCLSCAIAVAQTGNEEPEEKTGLTDIEQRMQKRISIDVNDQPIDLVIRQLVEQANLNYIKSPNVIGNVTVTFKDVPLEEALTNILAVHNCLYMPTDNVIRIITSAEMVAKAEPILTESFEIVYVDAEKVVEALDKFKSPQGSVSSIKGTSHIIVTDTETKMGKIKDLLEKIDRITPQILVEARIYDITIREGFDIGVDWHVGRNTPLTDIVEKNTHNETVTKTGATGPTTSTTATQTETVDNTGGTPTTDVTVTETVTTSGTAGITGDTTTDIDEITKENSQTWLRESYRKSKPFAGGSFDTMSGGTVRFGLLNDAVDVDLVLNILHTEKNAKLLANPRILVLDNETAFFDIVTEHPYVERTISGGTITESVQFKPVGINLQVTPHVTREGMLRLHILPEFGVFVERVQLATSNVPVVDTRKVDTIALIRDGQTVVLGGLRKKDSTQNIYKVPLLGDLPLLGGLFKSETEETITSELVIFITPRVIAQEPVLSLDEQLALEETRFSPPVPASTRAEKKIVEESSEE